MTQLTSADLHELIQRFDQSDVVQALILMGSYARNEAGPYSDIDLIRFVRSRTNLLFDEVDGTHLDSKKRLVNISTIDSNEYEKWFVEPYEATKWIAGLRLARVLIDREEFFEKNLQERARNFIWDETIQSRANIEASRRMLGWTEEVHKGLEGLRRGNDHGRLLNALHGLSWGLSEVIQIQRGVLVSSDNSAFDQVELALGDEQTMIKLRRITFGLEENYNLGQRVYAGLKFYLLLHEQMKNVWQEHARNILEHTVEHIRSMLDISEQN